MRKPNQTAQKADDRFFPNYVSTLAVTDPELIETFDNVAFDEVHQDSKLNLKDHLIVQHAAIIVSVAIREYRMMAGKAL